MKTGWERPPSSVDASVRRASRNPCSASEIRNRQRLALSPSPSRPSRRWSSLGRAHRRARMVPAMPLEHGEPSRRRSPAPRSLWMRWVRTTTASRRCELIATARSHLRGSKLHATGCSEADWPKVDTRNPWRRRYRMSPRKTPSPPYRAGRHVVRGSLSATAPKLGRTSLARALRRPDRATAACSS